MKGNMILQITAAAIALAGLSRGGQTIVRTAVASRPRYHPPPRNRLPPAGARRANGVQLGRHPDWLRYCRLWGPTGSPKSGLNFRQNKA